MKKFKKIAALGLSCAFALSLAACGNDEPTLPLDTSPNPDSVKTEQVTAEQWNNAFGFGKYQSMSFKLSQTYLGQSGYTIMKFDGDKVYELMKVPGRSEEHYYTYEDDTAYKYSFNTQYRVWERDETEEIPELDGCSDVLASVSASYNSFTYNSTANAYVANTGSNVLSELDCNSLSVKIVAGQVSVINMSMTADGNMTATYQFYDLNKTSVNLPRINDGDFGGDGEDKPTPVPGGSTVSQSEWNIAFSPEAFYNVSVRAYSPDNRNYEAESKYDIANNRAYIKGYSQLVESGETSVFEMISAAIGDEYYEYHRTDNEEWNVYRTEQDRCEQGITSMCSFFMVFEYSQFKFDSAGQAYIATNLSIEERGEVFEVPHVEVRFEQKNLVYFSATANIEGETETQIYEFYDYGKTHIELPEVELPGGGDIDQNDPNAITQEEWNRALSDDAFRNVTITSYSGESEQRPVTMIDLDNKRTYQLNYTGTQTGPYERICAYIDGSYYSLYKNSDNNEWSIGESSENELDSAIRSISSMWSMFEYSQFQYDKISNLYRAYDIKFEESGDVFMIDEVVFGFENNNLAYFKMTVSFEGETMTQVYEFYDYGKTNIELPDVDIPNGQTK